jgi:hypothetical protein
VKSMQLNKRRTRLEPSRPHVWPVEILIPTYISSSETPASSLSRHLLRPDKVEGDRTEPSQENGAKGGVRSEKFGYGFDWIGIHESQCFRHDKGTIELRKEVLEWNDSADTPTRVLLEDGPSG